MNFLVQALQERATQLSYETDEAVEDFDDYQNHEEVDQLEDPVDNHEKTIDEIDNVLNAEVTLESLQNVLTHALSRGGMNVVEHECFALVQNIIGRQHGIDVGHSADMQSYTQLGAEEYTMLSSEQTQAAKNTLWEKLKALVAKLVQFAKRMLEKLTFSWVRIQARATKIIDQLSKISGSKYPSGPITQRSIIEPLYRKGAHLSVNEIKQVTKNFELVSNLISSAIASGKFDPKDTKASDQLLESLQKDMSMMPDYSPQIIPKDAQVSGWQRLKFWKQPEPIANLPKEIERLSPNECTIAAATIQRTAMLAKLDDSKVGTQYIKRLKLFADNRDKMSGTAEHTTGMLQMYPILYTAYCRFNHWGASYANAVLNYIEASAGLHDQPAKTFDEHGNTVEGDAKTKFKDVR